MSRIRTRTTPSTISYFSAGVEYLTSTDPAAVYEYMDDVVDITRKHFNPCVHILIHQPFHGFAWYEYINQSSTFFSGYYRMDVFQTAFEDCFNRALDEFNFEFDFQKNNDFELLNLVGELDDLIATFTLKFWKTLTYGSVNWGVLPLISDLRSLRSSFDDIFGQRFLKSIESFNERTSYVHKVDFDYLSTDGSKRYKFSGTLRLKGYFSCTLPDSSLTALAVLADELGVNPDARTVWDLIPFSFVIDYFLPIGDLLESLHPRGWFNPVFNFQGSATLSGDLEVIMIQPDPLRFFNRYPSSKAKCYSRRINVTNDLSSDKLMKDTDYKFGLSLRQLFNVGYLAKYLL